MITQIIGGLATVVGTILMLPQVIHSIKTKDLSGVSVGMLLLYFSNCALWLIYGLLIWAWPVFVCNGIALVIGVVQLGLKHKYNRAKSVS